MTLEIAQKRTIKLLKSSTPKEKLNKFVKGYVPTHYKRLSISMEKAIELAIIGATESLAYYGDRLYFTQALLMGAVVSGEYDNIIVVTPSQYGKSWLSSRIAVWLADHNRRCYVAGGKKDTTDIIMQHVTDTLQTVDESIARKLLEPVDKLERLQTGLSKRKISFSGGGSIEGISLGEHFKGNKSGNQAIGRGGDYIIDESAFVSNETYAELGRRNFANVDGKNYLSFEISNPHNKGRFYDKLTQENIPKGMLVVWADVRTAFEEDRVKSIEQVISSEFFQNKSTCQRYFLCELPDENEDGMFGTPQTEEEHTEKNWEYFLGVDSAYKGKDKIKATLSALDAQGQVHVIDTIEIEKGDWQDGVTSRKIITQLLMIIEHFEVKGVCVDVGYGVYIVEGLAHINGDFELHGINFGAGTTKERVEKNHYSAKYGANKRAEMHIDLQENIDNRNIFFTEKVYEEVIDELVLVSSKIKSNGKTAIVPKEEIKAKLGHSPDTLDSVLLSLHAIILYKLNERFYIYS